VTYVTQSHRRQDTKSVIVCLSLWHFFAQQSRDDSYSATEWLLRFVRRSSFMCRKLTDSDHNTIKSACTLCMEATEHGVRTPWVRNRKAVALPQRVSVKYPWYLRFSDLQGRGFFRVWFTEVWHLVCEYRYVCGVCYLFFVYLLFLYMRVHPCSFCSLYACFLSPYLCVCMCVYIVIFILFKIPQFISYKYNYDKKLWIKNFYCMKFYL